MTKNGIAADIYVPLLCVLEEVLPTFPTLIYRLSDRVWRAPAHSRIPLAKK